MIQNVVCFCISSVIRGPKTLFTDGSYVVEESPDPGTHSQHTPQLVLLQQLIEDVVVLCFLSRAFVLLLPLLILK